MTMLVRRRAASLVGSVAPRAARRVAWRAPPRASSHAAALPATQAQRNAALIDEPITVDLGALDDAAFAPGWLRAAPTEGRVLAVAGGPDPFELVAPEMRTLSSAMKVRADRIEQKSDRERAARYPMSRSCEALAPRDRSAARAR